MCPGSYESAGKNHSRRARKGNNALRVALCEAAWAGVGTKNTYISAQFRRFRRRFGTRSEAKATFAVAHTLLVICWHLLANQVPYDELGDDWFDRRHEPPPKPAASSPNSNDSATPSPSNPPPDPTDLTTTHHPGYAPTTARTHSYATRAISSQRRPRPAADLTHIDYYRCFNHWKSVCIMQGVYARYLHGQKSGKGVDVDSFPRRIDRRLRLATEAADRLPA
jgi:hypothetical protein